MKRVICFLGILLSSQSAVSSTIDQADLLKICKISVSMEETPEIVKAAQQKFSSLIQKELYKTNSTLKSNDGFINHIFQEIAIPSEAWFLIIPSLSISKIIYPFHSFP